MAGLLLGTDLVTLLAHEDEDTQQDAHGWAGRPSAPVWTGTGNLQLAPGRSDPQATGGGGHGPFDPAVTPAGDLFLPSQARPADGMTAVIRGRTWVLSQVRNIPDPTGGVLSCWAAAVTEDTGAVVADA